MRLICTAVFLLFWGMTAVFLYRHWEAEQQKRLAENNVVLATTYRASLSMYRLATEILVTEVIQRPEVIATFADGVFGKEENRDLIRGRLYRLLAPAYAQLKQRGIQQLAFHSADGHSFLRFHAPDKFGDSLFDLRPSVRLANMQKRPTFGFETGRTSAAFRYVFPLSRGTQHLGSVEAGVSFRKISEAMAEIDPEREYLLVLKRSAVDQTLFEEQRTLYSAAPVHDDFLVENPEFHLPSSPLPPSPAVQTLNARLKADPRVLKDMPTGQAFSLAMAIDSDDWAVDFAPINDLLGVNIAYVISYAKAPYLAGLRRDFFINLGFATLTLGGVFWLSIRLLNAYRQLQQAYTSLGLEKQQLQIVTDTIDDGLFVMDRQGHIVQVNPAFTEILGYQADEIVGKVGHNLFHVHGDGSITSSIEDCPIVTATSKGAEYAGEELFRHKNGQLLTAELSCKPIINRATIDGSVTAFRDISVRKAAEDRLREADRLKSEFLANISHELRTPMTVFMAAIEHLQDIDKNSKHQQLLEMAAQASQRLVALVNELLDFSKIEAQGVVVENKRFRLRECLNEIVVLMTLKAKQKNLRLDLEVTSEVPNFVESDPYRLGQVLINLLENAIKFTEKGAVKVTVQRQDQALLFTVSDTGIGIPANKLETIFEPFTQVDGSSTRRYGGTGLGLAITKKLVELMGGRISVVSRFEQGSVFAFTLPLKDMDAVS